MDKVENNNYWLGKEAFEHQDYKKAEQYLNQVIKSGFDFADVYNMLGIIYHQEGKYEKAVQSFERALEINPNYTDASMNLAVIYNDMGLLDKAKTVYLDAQARAQTKVSPKGLDPFSLGKLSNLHKDVGDVYLSYGMYEEAIEEYTKALALNPDFVDIRTKLGIALRDSRKYDDALVHLKRAASERPDYTPAFLSLALCYFKMGKKKEAKDTLTKVMKSEPDNKIAALYMKMLEP
jgi:tetratricopeptide (TPR) repeat protein